MEKKVMYTKKLHKWGYEVLKVHPIIQSSLVKLHLPSQGSYWCEKRSTLLRFRQKLYIFTY